MANQGYIIDVENKIIKINNVVGEALKNVAYERQCEAAIPGGAPGKLYDTNRDCWRTLRLNVLALRGRLDDLAKVIDAGM